MTITIRNLTPHAVNIYGGGDVDTDRSRPGALVLREGREETTVDYYNDDYVRSYVAARVSEAGSDRRWKRWLRTHFFRAVSMVGGRDGDPYLGEQEGRRRIRSAAVA